MKTNLFLTLFLICSFNTIEAQYISPTNSVPEGPSVAPLGWFMTGSTDVSNQDYWAGWAAYPWEGVVDNPPNGHTVWLTGFYSETAWTTITGLTPGDVYTFNFYMCELRSNAGGAVSLYDGTLSVTVAGVETLYPFTGGADNSWSAESITFTAGAATENITFKYQPPGLVNGNFWNISFSEEDVELACDQLLTEVSDTLLCLGDEVTLSAESIHGGTITWDGGISDGIAFEPPLGTTLYTATSDLEEDCEFEIEIVVNDYPEVDIVIDDTVICDGDSALINVSGEAESYSWEPEDIIPGEYYFPEIGMTEITLVAANGVCETTSETTLTMHENPIVDALVDDDIICLGESFIFSGEGADYYEWDSGIIDGEPYTPDETGVFAHFVTGYNETTGCSSSDYIYVTVQASPEVEIMDIDTEICEGESITLTGSGAATYEWDMGVEDGVAFEPPVGTTTYTLTGINLGGCEGYSSIEITVYEIPDVLANASETTICEGDEITLYGTGADSYVWDMGIVDGEPFTPDYPGGTYTVIGSSGPGCIAENEITITVNPLPEITANSSSEDICFGDEVTLFGSGGDTYEWEDEIIDGVPFVPLTTGLNEYTLIGVNELTGCSNESTVTVEVHESPELEILASSLEICFGESVVLSGSGASTYIWSDGIENGVPYFPAGIGTFEYTLIGVSEFGCESTQSITIHVNDCEPVLAGFELPSSICVNECITLNDTSLGNPVSWEWNFGGATEPNTSIIENPTICLNTVGTYTITLNVTSATGASSVVNKEFTVNPIPTIETKLDTIINLGGTASLIANGLGEGTYSWAPEYGVNCSTCSSTHASPTQDQVFIVEYIDQNGCIVNDSVNVLVNYVLSIGVPSAFSPNGDGNNDVLYVKGSGIEAISFEVYNRYGERVFLSTEQNIGWDGSYMNKPENPGVFTWVLFYTTSYGKKGKLKGNTTLIR
ncbi:T9SS type B sorting domain-containing protein [Crocinitomix algicola]|uniref:T9SS type B sorting domain-containing protein n=1 Tax=Crocinitomix algicola TaxID=1740263 RepID=UPI000872A305|nr:gliding motility-associated C-terminal domain-containing protein [Crocinitomix algicola]